MKLKTFGAQLVVACAIVSNTLNAQEKVDGMFVAGANYITTRFLQNNASVDPRILTIPWNAGSRMMEVHSEQRLKELAGGSKINSILSSAQAGECQANLPPVQCQENGYVAILTFGEPVLEVDSASVIVLVRMSRAATAADSASAKSALFPDAALRRLASLGSMQLVQLRFAGSPGSWRIVGHKIVGTS